MPLFKASPMVKSNIKGLKKYSVVMVGGEGIFAEQ